MSGMLSLMYVQCLFQFGAKVEKWEGYYGDKNYLDMFFYSQLKLIFILFTKYQQFHYINDIDLKR